MREMVMKKSKIIIILCVLAIFFTSLLAKKDIDLRSYSITSYKCIGCQECLKACPVEAISIRSGKAMIDQSKCIQCGICVNGNYSDYLGCPVEAINSPNEDQQLTDLAE